MEAYRDQYATLFRNGQDVVLAAVSADADTTLASWAREKSFPQLFASDSGGAAGRAYGVRNEERKTNRRAVFVIDREGKIAYRALPFAELSADAYKELGAAVEKTAGSRGGGGAER